MEIRLEGRAVLLGDLGGLYTAKRFNRKMSLNYLMTAHLPSYKFLALNMVKVLNHYLRN